MTKMIDASTLVYEYSQIDIWELPEVWYIVQFADREVKLHKNQLICSWYYWRLYSAFPRVPIKSGGAITEFYTANQHQKILAFIHWDIFNTLLLTHDIDVFDISGVAVEVNNLIFNVNCVEFVEYMPMGSVHDIVEILHHPIVVEAKRIYKEKAVDSDYDEYITAAAIYEMEAVIKKLLYTDPLILPDNAIKRLALMGLVNENQLLQLVGMRGYVKDVNNVVFPFPVESAYGEGINDLYEMAIETRDAAMAKLMQTTPLEVSEYFNRKNQLSACVVTEVLPRVSRTPLLHGGCTGYITVPMILDQSDVSSMIGKFHMVGDTPELLWYDNIHKYVDTIVKLRSVTGCGSLDPQHVCHVCVGWSSLIHPPGINYGYNMASQSGKIMTSRILSTKHLTKSSTSTRVVLDKVASRWLKTKHNVNGVIFFNDDLVKSTPIIRVKVGYCRLLNQVQHIAVEDLTPTVITNIPEAMFSRVEMSGIFDVVNLKIGGTGVSFSTEMLQYIKSNGYNVAKGCIEIDLSRWNTKLPLFITPNKATDVMTLFNDIKTYLEGSKDSSHDARISKCRSRANAISGLATIMKEGMGTNSTFNLTHLEILIKGLMVLDGDDPGDFSMPMPHDNIRFASTVAVVSNRSLGGMLTLQNQYTHVLNHRFLDTNPKIKHMMSPLIGGSLR